MKKTYKFSLSTLFCCVFMTSVQAQVFSGAVPQRPADNPITDKSSEPPLDTGLQVKNSVVQKNSDESVSTNTTEEYSNDDTFSPIKKNFNGINSETEQQNPDPKVFHFKIVNGEVSFDDNNKRNVLIYYDNYQIHRGFDKLIKCTIRVYVLNDLPEKITSLAFKLKWPDISTNVAMNQLQAGVTTYTDLMLLGEGCLKLDKTPTIEVNRCRIKGMSQEACADTLKWFPKKH